MVQPDGTAAWLRKGPQDDPGSFIPTSAPDYESGGQEFESLRARHNKLGLLKIHEHKLVAMQNEKIYMAPAWQRAS
jgi:hypothetical protein